MPSGYAKDGVPSPQMLGARIRRYRLLSRVVRRATVSRMAQPVHGIRLSPEIVAEMDAIAAAASDGLRKVTRSDVLRYAIELGCAALRERYGLEAPPGPRAPHSEDPL